MQGLIDRSHHWGGLNEGNVGIRGYTLTQIERFSESIEMLRRDERADRIEETALAVRTIFNKPAELIRFLKGLRSDVNKRRDDQGRD